MLPHRLRVFLTVSSLSLAFCAGAQDYPARPITMVMPYAPGGPGDAITRLFAGTMQKTLGQQIVVDNPAGASGSIGTAKVARSKADGYTLLMIHVSHATNLAMFKSLPTTRWTISSRLARPPWAPWWCSRATSSPSKTCRTSSPT